MVNKKCLTQRVVDIKRNFTLQEIISNNNIIDNRREKKKASINIILIKM